MINDGEGIWIPMAVWSHKNLTLIEKLFLVRIHYLEEQGDCFASNKDFAEFFDVSTRRCRQIISSLKEKGYVDSMNIYKGKQIKHRVLSLEKIGKDLFKESTACNPQTLQQEMTPSKENPKQQNEKETVVSIPTKDENVLQELKGIKNTLKAIEASLINMHQTKQED